MQKHIEYEDLVEKMKNGRVVAIVPMYMQEYTGIRKQLIYSGFGEGNIWESLHTPSDRIQIIKLATSNGHAKLELKPQTFLVVTDPYTMEALEIFAEKSNILYVTTDGKSKLLDVSEDMPYIYNQFFKPFQHLEELRGDLEE